jgi:K+-transporting ATPase A subunit
MEFLYIALLLGTLIVLAVPTGRYIAKVFNGEPTRVTPLFRPVELAFYRMAGVDETRDVLKSYVAASLIFNALVWQPFLLQELQGFFLSILRTWERFAGIRSSILPSPSPPTPTGRPTAARRP